MRRIPRRFRLTSRLPLLLSLVLLPVSTADAGQQPSSAPPEKGVKVLIYPILVQAPLYGATVNVPSIPGDGGGSEGGTATTDWSINALYMGGFEVYAGRLFSEMDVLWTRPSASHDATPRIDVETDIWAVTLKGGYRLYKGLGVTAGGRRLSVDLDTTIEFPRSDVTLQGSHTRAVWNPFVGADWRGDLTRKWTVDLSADFGIATGDDSHGRLRARADWQLIPHVSVRLGYQYLHLRFSSPDFTLGGVQRQVSTTQNMYGPEFGFGIVF